MSVRTRPAPCGWCGREVVEAAVGRRRRYCRRSCRQRAYEQRCAGVGAAASPDAVVLSAAEAADLADRVFTLRCAAEDVATAVAEGAGADELTVLCDALLAAARTADGWR